MAATATIATPLDGTNGASAPRKDQFVDMNDWLNAMVDHRVAKARTSDEEMSVELAWVAGRDHKVYQRRFKPLVYATLATIVAGFALAPGLLPLVVTFVALYFYIDFYSGVLHVVLDNPDFCRVPLLDVPCVEFQWHHTYAYDISTRKLTDVWGDLNPLLAIKAVVLFIVLGPSRLALMVLGVGMFWAYVNQFAHRMAHASVSSRPAWAQWLQRRRLIVPPAVHHAHHATYDTSYPVLSGHSRHLIDRLLKWVPNKWVWLIVFLAMSGFDIVLITWLLDTLLMS